MKKQSWSVRWVGAIMAIAISIGLVAYRLALPRAYAQDVGSGNPQTGLETQVSLTPLSFFTPSISPNICNNAQINYCVARFVAHVTPATLQNGSANTATVSVDNNSPVRLGAIGHGDGTFQESLQNIKDGEHVFAFLNIPAASTYTGGYTLKITADNGGQSNTSGGTIFQIVASEDTPTLGGGGIGSGATTGQWYATVVVGTDNANVNATMTCTANSFIKTVPEGVYTGNVQLQLKATSGYMNNASGYGVKVLDDNFAPNDTLSIGIDCIISATITPDQPGIEAAAIAATQMSITSSDGQVATQSNNNVLEVTTKQLNGNTTATGSAPASQSMYVTQKQASKYKVGDQTSKAVVEADVGGAAGVRDHTQNGAWVDLQLSPQVTSTISGSIQIVP